MRIFRQLILTCAAGAIAVPAWAQSSPWLPVPKTGTISVIQVSQNAERFYRGESARALPFGELEQNTTWVNVQYGFSDAVAIDARLGRSAATAGPLGEDTGSTDTTVGVTWRFTDEDVSGMPNMAVRFAVISAGDYDVGMPNAIGDGGDGYEASFLIGKILAGQLALSAELGMRSVNNNVPDQTTVTATAHWLTPMEGLIVRTQYHQQRSDGELDIGQPGFNPSRFPEVTEDIDRVSIGATVTVGSLAFGIDRFNTIGARNTGDFDSWAMSVSYNFDLFQP